MLASLAPLLAAALASCTPAPTYSWFNAGLINRADDVVMIWRHDKNQPRGRLDMSHGAPSMVVASDFSAYSLRPADGRWIARRLSLDHRWTAEEDEAREFPMFLSSGDRVMPHDCRGGENIETIGPNGITCPRRDAIIFTQAPHRGEPITIRGLQLVFGRGIDRGQKPCVVDLKKISPDADKPFFRSRHYVDAVERQGTARFLVSYLPGHAAYIADYGTDRIPLYRVGCDRAVRVGFLLDNPALSRLAKNPMVREFLEIRDIVPTANADAPAVLVQWREETEGAFGDVYAAMDSNGKLQRLPADAQYGLTFDGPVGFWLADPAKILLSAQGDESHGRGKVRFTIFDTRSARTVFKDAPLSLP